ncbi:putative bug family periplasmatic protein [Octadecabacter arcticus 238]|jgi:tripartite-type tricarboxylate transporter receptor subunit TctC|uniref:Putative bug family periplasmatic protein n=1 Tax=Octadecabacter arcticus 238 TaxID=391616 RepID=M9RNR8_9RHOB|nr:tripartite tricarboxylate transporter substrate binding protein [Octadecabacter arcticus]AGI71415.1 putative bug family periplasmatic protein [Octadecabacter arcticus 238]
MDRRSFLHITLAAPAIAALSGTAAFAQWEPRRPINLIVPYGAGGGTDSFARALAAGAESALSVPLVVVNRPGSSGITGATEVAGARPDGTTFMMTSGGSFLLTYLLRDTDVNPFDSFVTVGQIGDLTTSLMVPTNSPYQTIDDLVADARARPGEMRWNHTGRGSFHHIAGQGFMNAAGLNGVDVPFDGGGATRAAVISGQVDFGMIGIQQAAGFESELRVLALISNTRDSIASEVPTFAEQGYDVPVISSPITLFAPLGMDAEIVSGMEAALATITSQPEFAAAMLELGNTPAYLDGDAARARLEQMRDAAAPIIAAIE